MKTYEIVKCLMEDVWQGKPNAVCVVESIDATPEVVESVNIAMKALVKDMNIEGNMEVSVGCCLSAFIWGKKEKQFADRIISKIDCAMGDSCVKTYSTKIEEQYVNREVLDMVLRWMSCQGYSEYSAGKDLRSNGYYVFTVKK